jgi:hypothetical protein
MSMGNYDDEEFERRERLTHIDDEDVEVAGDDHHGSLEFDTGDSTEALLEHFQELNSE